jgi:putative membrane protein
MIADNTSLAEDRTELAEDRTLMAVERTMASWMSTSFGAIGVGLGFRALFGAIEPWWLPRLIASTFMVLAIVIVVSAERRACRALGRISAHSVKPPSSPGLRASAYGIATGAFLLLVAIWAFFD